MKAILKQRLTFSDFLLIAANLVPIWGVWFDGWDAKMIFLVYCLESVIVGLYNLVQMWMVTLVKKQDVWQNGESLSMVSGYVFMLFFLVHYGFFIFVQLKIFLSIVSIKGLQGDVFQLLFHFQHYLPGYAMWLLLYFTITYGLVVVKDFVMTGMYRNIDLGTLMFAPYARIFIQQFVVIVGSFALLFNKEGKVFILVFVLFKIFFELLINYQKIMEEAVKRRSVKE